MPQIRHRDEKRFSIDAGSFVCRQASVPANAEYPSPAPAVEVVLPAQEVLPQQGDMLSCLGPVAVPQRSARREVLQCPHRCGCALSRQASIIENPKFLMAV